MTAAYIVAGLVLLFVGGELVVRGAVLVAVRMRVSALMIGITVVGFGTSMPELVTSLESALIGAPGIAIGNIVGSNIANSLFILGVCALIWPFSCPANRVVRDGTLMLAAALGLAGLSLGGTLGRADGAILAAGLALYLWIMQRDEIASRNATDAEPVAPLRKGLWWTLAEVAMLLAGIAVIVAGAHVLVAGAIDLAQAWDISETVIGLTIVAVGTSLPELATSIVAAIRRQSEICYGNIVGSNVFNLLGIGGVTALTTPVQMPEHILSFDIPAMIAACLVMSVFAWTGARLTRAEGAVMLAAYVAYLAAVVA